MIYVVVVVVVVVVVAVVVVVIYTHNNIICMTHCDDMLYRYTYTTGWRVHYVSLFNTTINMSEGTSGVV